MKESEKYKRMASNVRNLQIDMYELFDVAYDLRDMEFKGSDGFLRDVDHDLDLVWRSFTESILI